ncbi:MAG: chemotaxis protein CheA [Myxococcales bacterium]|nr:chemotaxis protein CheA [Myxococcales bacterium]
MLDSDLLHSSSLEIQELLESASNALLAVEDTTAGEQPDVDELFRALHTMKGLLGWCEAPALVQATHAAEDLVDACRAGELVLTTPMIDLIFETLDEVSRGAEVLLTGAAPGEEFTPRCADLTKRLRAQLGEEVPEVAAAAAEVTVWWFELLDEERREAFADEQEERGEPLWAGRYVPAAECFFSGEDPVATVRAVPGLCWFAVSPRSPWPDQEEVGAFDPYTCNLQFHFLTWGDPRDAWPGGPVSAEATLELHALTRDELLCTSGAWTEETVDRDVHMRRLLEAQLVVLSHAESWPGRVASVAVTLKRILHNADLPGRPEAIDEAATDAIEAGDGAPMVAVIRAMLNGRPVGLDEASDVAPDEAPHAPPPTEEAPSVIPITAAPSAASEPPQKLAPVPSASPRGSKAAPRSPSGGNGHSPVLKVEQARIDQLMDIVGELVVAKNSLPYLAERAEGEFQSRKMAREIKAQHAIINRIAEDLQNAVMRVRMVPMSNAFGRFPRMVRDIAHRLGKQARLVMQGEDTEADKNIVEGITDPLVHLIRNSLDHGLETPEVRLAAGKPAEGRILLKATHIDDQVVLEISDDGAGIDLEVVARKALAKEMITEAELQSMSEAQVMRLLFAPGFSTNSEVSELSGRGVGMDVVNTMVMRASGELEVDSVKGEGTTIRITLPLSMAVTQVLLIETANETFGVPLSVVRETVRVPPDEIHVIKHQEAMILRDRLLPLYRLRKVLGMEECAVEDDGAHPNAGEAVLVVEAGGQTFGLIVDRFHAGLDLIVKPMQGVMSSYPLYSGTALLGDGRVLLVLNIKELLHACHVPQDRRHPAPSRRAGGGRGLASVA